MTYFKINDTDYSLYCNQLKISVKTIFKQATNAAGDTVVKFVNRKRTFTVGIIPLNERVMEAFQNDIQQFNVLVSYRDPKTNELVENVKCIIPNDDCEFYTIQADKVLYKAMTVVLQEL